LIDNDGRDCLALKRRIATLCVEAGRPDTLVRIVCQELESWYLGDPEALALAFADNGLRRIARKPRYRDPDSLDKPSELLRTLCPRFQKTSGARAIAPYLSCERNVSHSFKTLIEGIARLRGD
jgi:hypothetical protein